METIIGIQTASDSNVIKAYYSSGTLEDTYPAFNGKGKYMSNPIRAEIMGGSYGAEDFCMMAVSNSSANSSLGNMDLSCGSMQKTLYGYKSQQFSMNSPYNISAPINGIFNLNVQSGQFDSSTIDSIDNPSEFLTTYGVIAITSYQNLASLVTGIPADIGLIWATPPSLQQGVLIADDYSDKGRNDIIGMTTTSINYINDGFLNSQATLGDYVLNPCIESATAKENTTIRVTFDVNDIDGDDVEARAWLYYDDAYEQDSG
jgi:hypothetical protein